MRNLFYFLVFYFYSIDGITGGLFDSLLPPLPPYAVNTQSGPVWGVLQLPDNFPPYIGYYGVPYAVPPVGELRYAPPVPAKPWTSPIVKLTYSAPCLQFDIGQTGVVNGQEDCLFNNIFTRDPKPQKLKPVIFFICGGGFTYGDPALYNPKHFMNHDVVVVVPAYRLASMGFLNTGDDQVLGNMGFKDQNLALRWVKANIAKFGGDPNQITIMGESTGAVSVHMHMISPLSAGLYKKAVIQSGSVQLRDFYNPDPWAQAQALGEKVGCPTANSTVLTSCLRSMKGEDIVKVHVAMMNPLYTQNDLFAITKEAVVDSNTFMGSDPFTVLESGAIAKVPLLVGLNSGEGAFVTARCQTKDFNITPEQIRANWATYVPNFCKYPETRADITQALKDYYCPNDGCWDKDPWVNLTQMFSDTLWNRGSHNAAVLQTKYSPSTKTYLYWYTYESVLGPTVFSLLKATRAQNLLTIPPSYWLTNLLGGIVESALVRGGPDDPRRFGAVHGNDIPMAWSVNPALGIIQGPDMPFIKNFVGSLVQFVTSDDNLSFNGIPWAPINGADATFNYMQINATGGVIPEPFIQRNKFLDTLNIPNYSS